MRAILIFLSVFLSATRVWAEPPHFAVWRDNGRFHLLCDDLGDSLYDTPRAGEGAAEDGRCPVIHDTGRRFEINFHQTWIKEWGQQYEHNGSLVQEPDKRVIVEFWRDGGDRQRLVYRDADAAYGDHRVSDFISAMLCDYDQCPLVLTADELRFALGTDFTPDAPTRDRIRRLLAELDNADPHVRRRAVHAIRRYAIYLPAVVGDGRTLSLQQRLSAEWAMGEIRIGGTTELLLMLWETVNG